MRVLFDVAGFVIVGWGLMILLPGWSVTRRLVRWTAFPVLLAAIYLLGLVIVLLARGPGMIADFGSADGVIDLLTVPDVALVAWIHILAFDHLVGVVIFRDNLRLRVVPLPVQSVILFLTLMFGPVGFLSYWLIRVSRGHGTDIGGGGGIGGAEVLVEGGIRSEMDAGSTPREEAA